MPLFRASKPNPWLENLIGVALVVAMLWFGREVLIPLALAVLLTFLLAPICDRLERWRFGRVPSVMVVTAVSFIVLGAIAWIVVGQIIDLAGEIPKYRGNVREKIQDLRLPGAGLLSRATESIRQLTDEILATPPEVPPSDVAATTPAVPVQIVHGPLEPLKDSLAWLWDPMVGAGIVIVFVVFMLLQRDDLRDRVVRLIGQRRSGGLTVATQAIDDAARRVSRFLRMQLIINGTYGLAAGVGLFLIGVHGAVVWGVSAALVRFIPYAGPWLGALPPILLATVAFDSWTPVLLTITLFVVIELISNNVMEPWLYGSQTGVSAVAILASAVFWAWLWGPVGLVLATPLTVCLVVLGQYVPRLEFLSVLLSDEPSLPPPEHVYQRLLADNEDDVYEFAEKYLADNSLAAMYNDVLIPVLQMAQRDRHHERLEPERQERMYQILTGLVEEVGEHAPASVTTVPAVRVVCVPADDVADEITAVMLSQLLREQGVESEVIPAGGLMTEMIDQVADRSPQSVCICAVPPQAVTRLRHLCKSLRQRLPDVRPVIGFWSATDLTSARRRIKTCQPEHVVATLNDAVGLLRG